MTKTEDIDQVDEATLHTMSPTQRRHELELQAGDSIWHAQGKWMTLMTGEAGCEFVRAPHMARRVSNETRK